MAALGTVVAMIELSQDAMGTALRMVRFGQKGLRGPARRWSQSAARPISTDRSKPATLDAGPPHEEPSRMSEPSGPKPAAIARREAGRRASGCMAGLEAEERARIQRLSPIERMALALRMGRVARAVASRVGPR